jgi:hypothetical protein
MASQALDHLDGYPKPLGNPHATFNPTTTLVHEEQSAHDRTTRQFGDSDNPPASTRPYDSKP